MMLLLILSQEDQSNLHHRRDRERPCISLRSQFELEIPWQWLANKNIVILCMCLLTQSMMMLNQKLTKSIVRRCSKQGIYIKKGGERLPEGRVFFRNLWYCDSSSAMKQSYHCCLESKIMDSGLKICNSLPSLLQLFFLSIVLVMLCTTICAGFVSPG